MKVDLVKAKKKELKQNQVEQENKQLPPSSEIKCTLTVSKDGKPLNDGDDVVSGDTLSYTYHCEPKQTLKMKVEHFLFEKNSFGIVSGKPSDKVVIECIAPGTNKSLAKITLNIK